MTDEELHEAQEMIKKTAKSIKIIERETNKLKTNVVAYQDLIMKIMSGAR